MTGTVAVVTGAARGVGASLARQLSARGARVALLGLEPDELAAVSAQCPGSAWWEVDVTDGQALVRTAAEVAQRLGPAGIVVANAGIASAGPLLLADPTSYDAVIEVNLLGSVRTVRAFLPQVVQTRGYVLQVASLAALVPIPAMSAYCASKSGAEAFAHSLRGELRHHGVAVGVAYLSWTDTDMVRGADARPALGSMRARLPWSSGAPTRWSRRSPGSSTASPAGHARRLEDALREAGSGATTPVGAGGLANSRAQGRNGA